MRMQTVLVNQQGGIHVLIQEGECRMLSRKVFHCHGKSNDRKAYQENCEADPIRP
jgi:hypothetical protein